MSSRPRSTGRSKPVCTVIVLNYNYGRFVGEAIESALAQSCGATEVVAVDDGSTDDSLTVMGRYADSVDVLSQRNLGQAAAMNAAFGRSRGDVVIFLDADDVLEPTATEAVADAIRPGTVHAHWQMTVVDARGRPTGHRMPEQPLADGDLRERIRSDGPGVFRFAPTSGNAFDRTFLETVMPVPTVGYERGGADRYLVWLAAVSGAVRRIDAPQSRYRRHGSNDSWLGSLDQQIDRWMGDPNDPYLAAARRLGLPDQAAERWRESDWWYRLDAARAVIQEVVPADEGFALLDEQQWAARGTIGARVVHQFAPNGPPVSGAELVAELDCWVTEGVRHLVVAENAAWWADYYREFGARLEGARLCAESAGVRVYRLVEA